MSKIRVALIEDHDLIRLAIRKALLQRSEIELVGEATTVKDGYRLLLETHPDVAIVDIDLPDQTGIDLTRQLKEAQLNGSVPQTKVLILTLRDTHDVATAALSAGATSYCLKQISLEDLIEAVRETAQGRSWIDPQMALLLQRPPQPRYNN